MVVDRRAPAPGAVAVAVRAGHPVGRILVAAEVVLAVAAVVLDLLIPTLVLLLLMTASLAARHRGLASLGLCRAQRARRMVLVVLGMTVGWTVITLAVTLPVLEHITGERQDVSQFADLQGDLGALLVLLVLSWTLAAFGEELAYRGYVQTRIRELLGPGRVGIALAVIGSSALFGLAHTEQGVVGVALTFLDAVFFSALRYRFRTLWAAVLAHGFSNTLGLTAYFLVGPVYGLW